MLKVWTTGRLLSWLRWSEGRLKNFVAQRYEPILRFSSTPAYDMTLAEDIRILSDNPYIIDLSNYEARNVSVRIYGPAQSSAGSAFIRAYLSDDTTYCPTAAGIYTTGTTNRYTRADFFECYGELTARNCTGPNNLVYTSYGRNNFTFFADEADYIKNIKLIGSTTAEENSTLYIGTKIAVYIIKEVE